MKAINLLKAIGAKQIAIATKLAKGNEDLATIEENKDFTVLVDLGMKRMKLSEIIYKKQVWI